MRQMWVVFAEELRRAFRSPGTYALLGLFFLMTGALYFSVFFQASTEPQRFSPMQIFWELQWLPNLLWVPLITMRLLAPERRTGLLESALSTPTTPAAVVAGKYLAALVMYCLGWASAGVYMAITQWSGLNATELAAVFALPAAVGGMLFCLGSGVLFLALGLWCSSVTKSSILSGAFTVCLMLLYILLPTMLKATPLQSWEWMKPFYHLENLSLYAAGSIELAMLAAYGILAMIILFSATLSLEHKGD